MPVAAAADMPTYKVAVKWGPNKYDVELDPSQPPSVFKAQLFALSGVAPDRMKVMLKGVALKDEDQDWTRFKGLQTGANFLMMGTAGELPKAPAKPVVFLEDVAGSHASATLTPPGLTNLGNTCYLASTLQCLRQVTELQSALATAGPASYGQDMNGNVAVALRDLYKQLNGWKSGDAAAAARAANGVPPMALLTAFRAAYPQFALQDPRSGVYAQQDAEEAWNTLVSSVRAALSPPGAAAAAGKSPVERLMGVALHNESTCADPAATQAGELPTVTDSSDLRLTVAIGAQTNSVTDALGESLVQTLEKTSPSLGRTAQYTVKSAISRLPKYLCVHFNRFFWRADIKQRVKIRRNVTYPAELDMYKFCTPELQAKLAPARDGGAPHPELAADAGCSTSARYELCAVLTHLGASSDSGHYIAWGKDDGQWYRFDDDKVSPCSEADVLRNSGVSADGHIAYLVLYRAKDAAPMQQ